MRKQMHTRAVTGALTILGIGVLASCDSRQLTSIDNGNVGVPALTVEVPSARQGAVGIDQPVGVTVRATHNLSLLAVFDTAYIENGTTVRRVYSDSVRFTSATTSNTRQYSIPVTGSVGGDQLRIVSYAVDGRRNVTRRDTVFAMIDTRPQGTLAVLTPSDSSVRTMLGAGDSVLARVEATGSFGIHSISAVGFSIRGSTTTKLDTIIVYSGFPETFPNYPRQVTSYRQLKPTSAIQATDTVIWFQGTITDSTGKVGKTNAVALRRVTGPTLTIERPQSGLTRSEGDMITVDAFARDPDGVSVIRIWSEVHGVRQQLADTTITHKQDTLRLVTSFRVPDGTAGTTIRFLAQAWDLMNIEGPEENRSVQIVGMATDVTPPVVRQMIPLRLELDDTLRFDVSDERSVRRVAFTARALNGSLLASDTMTFSGGGVSSAIVPFVLNGERAGDSSAERLAKIQVQTDSLLRYRGQRVVVRSWADDTSGNRGYATRTLSPQTDSLAVADTVLLVYGVTYALPSYGGRASGTPADIAVDTGATRVYVSNISENQLEVWHASTRSFGGFIKVGSQPWGLSVGVNKHELFVANSGGTTISVVDIAPGVNPTEESRRLHTPNAVAVSVGFSENISTGVRKYDLPIIVDYSDRPQYLAQSENGSLYYSTRPTSAASQGTLRRLDPDLPVVTVRQIWQYADRVDKKFLIVNADRIAVIKGATNDDPDQVEICDRPYGTNNPEVCARNTDVYAAVADLRAAGSDVEAGQREIASLALTDTTFVAAGGDLRVLAFGEGATSRPGRVILVRDPLGTSPFGAHYSDELEVKDLINNASDRVFGVALNRNSSTLGVHGIGAFFADTSLRLKGSVAIGGGAGIGFHPLNDGTIQSAEPLSRTVFVAEADMTVAVLDTYFYRKLHALALKENITGPIRAVRSNLPGMALSLYGLTRSGLVVIHVRDCDIDPARTGCS